MVQEYGSKGSSWKLLMESKAHKNTTRTRFSSRLLLRLHSSTTTTVSSLITSSTRPPPSSNNSFTTSFCGTGASNAPSSTNCSPSNSRYASLPHHSQTNDECSDRSGPPGTRRVF